MNYTFEYTSPTSIYNSSVNELHNKTLARAAVYGTLTVDNPRGASTVNVFFGFSLCTFKQRYMKMRMLFKAALWVMKYYKQRQYHWALWRLINCDSQLLAYRTMSRNICKLIQTF